MKEFIYKKLDKYKYLKFNNKTKEKKILSLEEYKNITNTLTIKRISEEDFLISPSNYILLLGMSSSGKSTLANKLLKKNYLVISLDDILRKIAKEHPMKEKIYGVYRGKYPEVRNKIIKNLSKIINTYHKVIIEGAIQSKDVIKDIINISNKIKLYYKEPKSNKFYEKQIINRVLADVNNNTRITNFVWESLDKKDVNFAFKNKKLNNNIINKIRRHVKMRIHYLVDDYKKVFNNLDFIIII